MIRKREIDAVFAYLKNKKFDSGIEFGAGDGYQTTLLASHCNNFISSDLNFKRIKDDMKIPEVQYKECDADNLDGVFEPGRFNFIFSSNLIEHLSNPKGFLSNTRSFLSLEGYAVHVGPGRFVKCTYIFFHYINLFTLVIDRLVGLFFGKKIFRGSQIYLENNINVTKERGSGKLKKFLLPSIHGNFKSHTEEFIAFGRKKWEQLFIDSKFEIVAYIKGPAFSGYGFGLNTLRCLFEYIGVHSEHIFILRNKD
jgi:hypothetical protein